MPVPAGVAIRVPPAIRGENLHAYWNSTGSTNVGESELQVGIEDRVGLAIQGSERKGARQVRELVTAGGTVDKVTIGRVKNMIWIKRKARKRVPGIGDEDCGAA